MNHKILERKGCKAEDIFFKPFDKTIVFNGFKMFSFMCKSHLQEIILSKNMFDYSLKLILRVFKTFYVYGYKSKY
jgi:hypothetical protein